MGKKRSKTVTRVVRQYSQGELSAGDMEMLLEIGARYRQIKDEVYRRYGGIRSIEKISHRYAVKTELNATKVRERFGIPTVYYERAVLEALGDLRGEWGRTKSRVREAVRRNKGFTKEEQDFLYYILRTQKLFAAILCNDAESALQDTEYCSYTECVDTHRLENYLRRQIRKRKAVLHAGEGTAFSVDSRGYRYGDGGIYLTSAIRGKRIHILLTDRNRYERELKIQIDPAKRKVILTAPIERCVRYGQAGKAEIGLAIGLGTMLTTDAGKTFGTDYGKYQEDYSEYMYRKNQSRDIERNGIPDRKIGSRKYNEQKNILEERLRSYMGAELNRFFREESPQVIFLPRIPPPHPSSQSGEANYVVSTWRRGDVERRLAEKCEERGIPLIYVKGAGIGKTCNACGATGVVRGGEFCCKMCGRRILGRENAAKNALLRGQERQISDELYKALPEGTKSGL